MLTSIEHDDIAVKLYVNSI